MAYGVCSYCNGSGNVRCYDCAGSGKCRGRPCFTCRGTGWRRCRCKAGGVIRIHKKRPFILKQYSKLVMCSACGGRGRVGVCPYCHGKRKRYYEKSDPGYPVGYIFEKPEPMWECKECDGSGKILCKVCKGKGQLYKSFYKKSLIKDEED